MRIRWLGRVPYREAWDLQRAISRRSTEDYLLLLEHPAVYTLGRSASADHVLVDPVSVGADQVEVDRGGDVTYHGPGQLVGYPLLTVGPDPDRGRHHVHQVEQLVIDALVALGMPPTEVGRLVGYPGVWVGLQGGPPGPDGADDGPAGTGSGNHPVGAPRKICAIGVRTARGRTTHGFALNVSTDLAMFGHIIPCGIADKPVTSLAAEGFGVTMGEVVDALVDAARAMWGEIEDDQRVIDRRLDPSPAAETVHPGAIHTGTIHPVPIPVSLGVSPGSGGRPDTPSGSIDAPSSQPPTRGQSLGRSLDRRLERAGVESADSLPIGARKPSWLRVPVRMGDQFLHLRRDLRQLDLVTVCEEAGCPNISECWTDGTATFMINGSRCTRACAFCQVDTRHPVPLDEGEPDRVAEAVVRMRLAHAVVTCVARDDLADGGAGAFARTIGAIRAASPGTSVEVLISDFRGARGSLQAVIDAAPDVLNHNIETVARLQLAVRPSAGYARSLTVLARAKDAGLTTKSGLIVGMGEREEEVLAVLRDLRAVGVDIVTVGQYLRPSVDHLPVARWWTPDELDRIGRAGREMGFRHVQASPLTRSSYHAREAAGCATDAGPANRTVLATTTAL